MIRSSDCSRILRFPRLSTAYIQQQCLTAVDISTAIHYRARSSLAAAVTACSQVFRCIDAQIGTSAQNNCPHGCTHGGFVITDGIYQHYRSVDYCAAVFNARHTGDVKCGSLPQIAAWKAQHAHPRAVYVFGPACSPCAHAVLVRPRCHAAGVFS